MKKSISVQEQSGHVKEDLGPSIYSSARKSGLRWCQTKGEGFTLGRPGGRTAWARLSQARVGGYPDILNAYHKFI